MQSSVAFFVALMASASAHHLGMIPHAWATAAPAGAAVRYIVADPTTAAEEVARAQAWSAGSTLIPLARTLTDPAADALAAAKFGAARGAMVPIDAASAIIDPTGAADALAAGEVMEVSPATALYGPRASGHHTLVAAKLADLAKYAADGIPAIPETSGRLVKVCAGGACKIVDEASLAASAFIDPSAADALAAAKFNAAGEVMVPIDAASAFIDPSAADALVAAKFGAARGIMEVSPAAALYGPRASGHHTLVAAKLADMAKYAADGIPAIPEASGRLVKVCAGGACKIVDEASLAADLSGPASAAHAAIARGMAAAKNADEAAKYADAVKYAAVARGLAATKYAEDAAKYGGSTKYADVARGLAAAKYAEDTAKYADSAKYAAVARGLAAAKYAEDAAKYADALDAASS